MKHCLTWGVLLFVSIVLQSTILPGLSYHGVHADLLLIVVISSSLLMGKDYGAVVGFSAGLLQDLAAGSFFGMHTFSKMVLGYAFGMAEKQVFKEHTFLPIMAMSFATLANCFITSLIMLCLGYRFNLLNNMISIMIPLLIYNVVLAFPVHKLICRIATLVKNNR